VLRKAQPQVTERLKRPQISGCCTIEGDKEISRWSTNKTDMDKKRRRSSAQQHKKPLPSLLSDLKLCNGKSKVAASPAEAWLYRDTHVLPRKRRDHNGEKAHFARHHKHRWQFRRAGHAEPGEHYSLCTSFAEIGSHFGVGMGLYFRQLQWLAGAAFVWGLCNVRTALHFASAAYSDKQLGLSDWKLQGSAACTRVHNITASSCTVEPCELYTVHDCEFAGVQGKMDIIGTLLVAVLAVVFGFVTSREAALVDESIQTAQDYSLTVEDPDRDATDPHEWANYFKKFGEVDYVSIALSNRSLLQLLAERRQLIQALRYSDVPATRELIRSVAQATAPSLLTSNSSSSSSSTALRKTNTQQQQQQKLMFSWCTQRYSREERHVRSTVARLLVVTDHINALLQQPPAPVVKVFVTFEWEAGQRSALHALTTGLIPAAFERSTLIAAEDRFRGTNVLLVQEAPEPSEVIWQNLDKRLRYRLLQQLLSAAVTAAVVTLAYYAIIKLLSGSSKWGAIGVSVISTALPMILKIVVTVERHINVTTQEDSLVGKLVSNVMTIILYNK
jgi:hypothetical protein